MDAPGANPESCGAQAMTRDEREQRIAELSEQIAEGEARIEARRRAREADPFAYDDHLRAERAAEPERDAYVQQNDAAAGLVYKRMDDALQPAPEPDWSQWEAWLKGHLDILREEMIDAVAEGMVEFFKQKRHELDRELTVLRNENAELKAMLGDVVARLGEADTKLRNMAADVDGERKDHIGRMTAFQVEVAELRGRMGAILRDFTT
jgi:hypothetical protein